MVLDLALRYRFWDQKPTNIPAIKAIIRITTNMKNKNLAIVAAPDAIPEKPKSAATKAITRKIIAHLSIIVWFWFEYKIN
jgi:hypothetical protein